MTLKKTTRESVLKWYFSAALRNELRGIKSRATDDELALLYALDVFGNVGGMEGMLFPLVDAAVMRMLSGNGYEEAGPGGEPRGINTVLVDLMSTKPRPPEVDDEGS